MYGFDNHHIRIPGSRQVPGGVHDRKVEQRRMWSIPPAVQAYRYARFPSRDL